MSTKVCPNCGVDVPTVANLCKQCMHDFNVVVERRRSPLFPIVLLALACAIVSAGGYAYMAEQNKTFKVSVDRETESIVFTTRYATRTEAERVYFKDVANIEYVANATPRPFEIAVITTKGDRFVYSQSDDPIDYPAKQLADMVGRPVTQRDLAKE